MIRVGVIGAGAIGRFHARTLASRLPGVCLGAVADIDARAAREAAAELGCPSTGDPGSLLEDGAIDAVVVATPGPTHPEVIVQAASAGKAIFCEKPLAWDLASADRALAAVVRAGVILQVGFQRRFHPAYRRAYDLARSGRLGRIEILRSTTRDPSLADPSRVPPWAIFRETLIHDLDLLSWLAGARPLRVLAVADALVAPERRDAGLRDAAAVIVHFEGGAIGTADAIFRTAYGYDVRAEVCGSEGMVTIDPAARADTVTYGPSGQVTERASWFLDLFAGAYAAELAAFVEAVRTGGPSPCTGAEARRALAVAVAAIASAQEGRAVDVEDPPQGDHVGLALDAPGRHAQGQKGR